MSLKIIGINFIPKNYHNVKHFINNLAFGVARGDASPFVVWRGEAMDVPFSVRRFSLKYTVFVRVVR